MGEYFSVRFTEQAGRDKVWRAIIEDIEEYLPADGCVVDCGTGYGSFINNVRAKSRIAIDMEAESRKHLDKGVRFIQGSIASIKLKAGTADAIFASNLLEHLTYEEVAQALDECSRVLRRGGHLILIQPNFRYAYRSYFDDYTHRSVFTDTSLADRLKAHGFSIERVEERYLPLTMKSRLPKSYWLTKLYLALPFSPMAGQMLVIGRKP